MKTAYSRLVASYNYKYQIRNTSKKMKPRFYITNGVTRLYGFDRRRDARTFINKYLK